MALVAPAELAAPEVSVIIPLHRDGEQFRKCLSHFAHLSPRTSFEIIVVSDQPVGELPSGVVHVQTGSPVDTSPGTKRDAGAKVARGSIFAYIDDDAYPAPSWLDRAVDALKQTGASGVSGPGLTPPDSGWRQRLGGAVYESRVGAGPLRHRFLSIQTDRVVDDAPAFNFVVRRDAMEAIGGWSSTFYGGEDTKVCLSLVDAGHRIVYAPNVVTYHCRRPIFGAHLRQIGNVGRHRGFFVRKYPTTSRRAVYFLPALVVITALFASTAAVTLGRGSLNVVVGVVAASWAALSLSVVSRARLSAPLFPAILVLHHATYSVNFLRGLLGKELTQ